jgi:hypothetical protein
MAEEKGKFGMLCLIMSEGSKIKERVEKLAFFLKKVVTIAKTIKAYDKRRNESCSE